jgi:hypothetical protein
VPFANARLPPLSDFGEGLLAQRASVFNTAPLFDATEAEEMLAADFATLFNHTEANHTGCGFIRVILDRCRSEEEFGTRGSQGRRSSRLAPSCSKPLSEH